jgi:hypothetical protein
MEQNSNKQNGKNTSRNMMIFAVALIALNIIVYVISVLFNLTGSPYFTIYENTTILIASFSAMFSMFLAMGTFDLKLTVGKVWLLLSLGLLLWFIGDVIYAYYQVILPNLKVYPSWADPFYILGYLVLIPGTLLQINVAKAKLGKGEIILIAVLELVFLAIVGYYVIYLALSTPISSNYTILAQIVSILYPVLDLFLFLTALVLVFRYRGGEVSKDWLWLLAAFLITAIYDSYFSYAGLVNNTTSYLITDHIYLLQYFLYAIGALKIRQTFKTV